MLSGAIHFKGRKVCGRRQDSTQDEAGQAPLCTWVQGEAVWPPYLVRPPHRTSRSRESASAGTQIPHSSLCWPEDQKAMFLYPQAGHIAASSPKEEPQGSGASYRTTLLPDPI